LEDEMVKNYDHVTIVVRDAEAAKEFFNLLGFEEDKSVVLSGEKFEKYMRVDGIEAQHITMVLAGASPRMEIQLLKYNHPDPIEDPNISNLTKLGYNHVCFAVDDIEAEVEKLKAAGVEILNDVMSFNDRKLVYFAGPEGVTLELAQRL
jgi:catechol 2,3-dioxygenase-like lactoylglutathione lyase family enzyme